MIAEVMANVAWMLMKPTHRAAINGVIRPKADAALMIARLHSASAAFEGDPGKGVLGRMESDRWIPRPWTHE